MKPLSLTLLLAACSMSASAASFLPFGGFSGKSHFAIETSVSGFKAAENAILSHGSLPQTYEVDYVRIFQ